MEDVSSGAHEGGVRRADLRRAWHRGLGVLISIVRWFGTAAAALLAVHVILTIGGANPDNGITQFVAAWAEWLALGFQDLFMPADPELAVLINYGAAALILAVHHLSRYQDPEFPQSSVLLGRMWRLRGLPRWSRPEPPPRPV